MHNTAKIAAQLHHLIQLKMNVLYLTYLIAFRLHGARTDSMVFSPILVIVNC